MLKVQRKESRLALKALQLLAPCPKSERDEAEDNMLWRLDEDGLLHPMTGLVADIPGSNEDAGVGLIGYHDIHGGDNQRFTFDRSLIRSDFVKGIFKGLLLTEAQSGQS